MFLIQSSRRVPKFCTTDYTTDDTVHSCTRITVDRMVSYNLVGYINNIRLSTLPCIVTVKLHGYREFRICQMFLLRPAVGIHRKVIGL